MWRRETDADLEHAACNSNSAGARGPSVKEDALRSWQNATPSFLVRGMHAREDFLTGKDLLEAPIEGSAMRSSLSAMTPQIDLDLHFLTESQRNQQKHLDNDSIVATQQHGRSTSRLPPGLARLLLSSRPNSPMFPKTIGGVHRGSGVTALALSGARMGLLQQILHPDAQVIQLLRQREILRLREEIVLMRQELRSRQAKKLRMRSNLYSAGDHSLALARMDGNGGARIHHNALDMKSYAKGGFASIPRFLHTDPISESLIEMPKKKEALPTAKKGTGFKTQDSRPQVPLPAKTKTLALPSDAEVFSGYQCLIRESIELFEVQKADVSYLENAQGRNSKVELGQVGFRCCYCAHRPLHWRGRGAVYFPGNLTKVYQASQNMSSNHFLSGCCDDMPESVKKRFSTLRQNEGGMKRNAGKKYWTDACRGLGLEHREGRRGLWFCS